MEFSLLDNPWIRVELTDGTPALASLRDALTAGNQVKDITEPPITRLAILRLLLAMNSSRWDDGEYSFDLMGTDDAPGFLQVGHLPPASARTAAAIISMQDGNGPALNPVNLEPVDSAQDLARALVTAYFCDRGGLKARVKGLPISGAKPLHMGNLIAFRPSGSLAEMLAVNAVPRSDWTPWWARSGGVIDYGEKFTGEMIQYLLWPWRRVQVVPGGIVIAAGTKLTGLEADPWSLGRAALRHLNGLGEEEPDYPAEVTALVLSQATPVACWRHSTPGTAESQ